MMITFTQCYSVLSSTHCTFVQSWSVTQAISVYTNISLHCSDLVNQNHAPIRLAAQHTEHLPQATVLADGDSSGEEAFQQLRPLEFLSKWSKWRRKQGYIFASDIKMCTGLCLDERRRTCSQKSNWDIPLHLNRNKFVVKEWDWLLSLVVIIGYYHWLNISVVIINGYYQRFWCPSFIRFFFCVWQFSSYFTSVRNKLCPSIMNTTVLCGSFYAPCINFHSFIYSFNGYLSSSVPAIAAMNQHRGLVALHFVSNPHSTRKDHLHQAQCYISNLFVALLLQYITNLNLISLK